MADEIIDVVTRLSYQVEDQELKDLSGVFVKNMQDVEVFQRRLNNLESTLAKTSANDAVRRDKLTSLINKQKQAIDGLAISTLKEIENNEKLQQSLVQGTTALAKYGDKANTAKNATFALSQVLREGPAFANSFQTGLLAISNNLIPLKEQFDKLVVSEGSAAAALSTLGKSLFSTTNLLTIGVTLLTVYGKDLYDLAFGADTAADSMSNLNKEFAKIDEQARKSATEDITNLRLLYETATNVANSQELRYQAAKKILEIYPELNKQTNEEAIVNGKAANAINAVAEALINKSLAAAAGRKIDVLSDEDLRLRDEEVKLTDKLTNSIKERDDLLKANEGNANQFARNSTIRSIKRVQELQDEKKAINEQRKSIKDQQQELLNYQQDRQRLAADVLGVNALIPTKEERQTRTKSPKERIKKSADIEKLPLYGTEPVPEPEFDKIINQYKKVQIEQDYTLDNIRASIQGYQTLANAAIRAYNQIEQAQQQQINREISAQEKRVEQATILAERGNAQILQIEKDRLDKLEIEREKSAERQIQLNALLQASNAAVALTEALLVVTNAGKTGDPYSTAARIAAAVAAVAAGFAIVGSLVTASRAQASGFAEGGYTGDGGKYEAAGTVHRGEFVITKEQTARNRAILEAIHAGAVFNVPSFSKPTMTERYATNIELKGVEKKLDTLIEVSQRGGVNVSQKLDASGFSQAVQTMINRENKKWS